MTTIAYLYSEPLWETAADPFMWGLEVERVYQDLGSREQLQQLIRDCQLRAPNYLLLRRLDELGDTLAQVNQTLNTLESLNIEIIAIDQEYSSFKFKNRENLGNKSEIIEIIAQTAKNQRSRQLKRGYARNRLKHLPPPGRSPFGYRRGKDGYIIDRATAPMVKDFFERFLLFGSLRDAVRYLERKYGKKIAVSTGKHWLTNPVYRGDLCYQNSQIVPDTHTPIISREEAAQIDRLLRRNRSLPPRSASASRCLAGLVRCGRCHGKMKITSVTARKKQRKYLYLMPTKCPQNPQCKSINYEEIFQRTIASICEKLPPAVAQLNLSDSNSLKNRLQQQITQKQEIIQQLSQLIELGILDLQTAQMRTYKLNTEIAKLNEQMAQLPPANLKAIASAISIPQFWLDLSEAERRFYLREFIREIVLTPCLNDKKQEWLLDLIFIF